VRLAKFGQDMADLPFYVIPLEHHFLFGEKERFLSLVSEFIRNFSLTDNKK
jgi:tetraacyldisaccharide 4'-kinase